MKKRPAPTVYKALRRRIVLPMVALWLVLITLITCISAREFFESLEDGALRVLTTHIHLLSDNPSVAKLIFSDHIYVSIMPESSNFLMLPQRPNSMSSKQWFWGKWDLVHGFRYDICWYDEEGNVQFPPGYYLTFTHGAKDYYIDLNESETLRNWAREQYTQYNFTGLWIGSDLQLQGYLEGDRFHLSAIKLTIADHYWVNTDDHSRDGSPITVSRLNTTACDSYGPFQHRGKVYQSAGDLLKDPDIEGSSYGLFSAVITMRLQNASGGSAALAIHCRPIVYVGIRLIPFYLVSGILLWIALALLLWNIRRKLTEPLDLIIGAYAADRVALNYNWNPWAELQALGRHFDRVQPERHQAKTEVQRLTTALEYAENAEKHRRQMVSSIAHELKTPLAIIHSYAEGLQSGISAEKRDRYLTVILEETERMDGLVMEMLDLSRLEAGKVKLSTDTVVPAALIRDVFSRLEPAAAEKELQIELNLGKDFTITADEARLEQVIRNFAHNAIRYTPQGGHVYVLLEQAPLGAVFTFRNDSPPLSDEALERVFDSFYRADDQPGGTGLGLAISKSIVTLHGGTCSVSNTPIGVQFRFYIPY